MSISQGHDAARLPLPILVLNRITVQLSFGKTRGGDPKNKAFDRPKLDLEMDDSGRLA
jgi:hypothetical protein